MLARWSVVLAGLVVVAAPGAQAAGLILTADDVAQDLVPGASPQLLRFHATAQCPDVLHAAATGARLVVAPRILSPYLTLSGSLETPIPLDDCMASPQGTLQWSIQLQVNASLHAPGLELLAGELTGRIERPGVGNLTGETPFRVRTAFLGGLHLEARTPEFDPATGEGLVLVIVTNTGNAKTTLISTTSGGPGQLEPADPGVVYSPQSGLGNQTILAFPFNPPDRWTDAQFTIAVSGHAFGAPAFATPHQTVSVAFTNPETPSKDTPGPALAILLVLLFAVALRRRA